MARGTWIPSPIRRRLVTVYNRWLAFQSAREVSVKNVALRNDLAAFEKIYATPALVSEYLAPERLDFYERVADYCAKFRADSVIDVGCGTGHLLAAFARRMPHARMVGVDHSPAAIALLSQTQPGAAGIVADIYTVSLQDTFDLVLCTEVLEHLYRPGDALNQLLRLGERVVVTVPDGELDSFAGHVNFWKIDEFSTLLNEFGDCQVERLDAETLVAVLQRSVPELA